MVDLKCYHWSSYLDYINETKEGITDTKFVLDMINKEEFIEYHKAEETEEFVVTDKVKKTDEKIRREIIKRFEIEPHTIGTFN